MWVVLVICNYWLFIRGWGGFVNDNSVGCVLMVCFFVFVVLVIVVGYGGVLEFIVFRVFKIRVVY